MDTTLTIQFSLPESSFVETSLFFRIEQDIPSSDPPTVDQVAQAIDSVTGQDYCNGTASSTAYDPGDSTGQETTGKFQDFFSEKLSDQLVLQDFASQLGLGEQCRAARVEDITIQIYIFWQTEEIAASYRLVSSSGAKFSDPKIITQTLTKEFTVSEAEYLNTEYYFNINKLRNFWDQVEFEWIGNVVNADKNIVSGPSPSLRDNSIFDWGETLSGTFRVTFPTKYHAVDVTIKSNGGSYDTIVYGVWIGDPVVLQLVVPSLDDNEKDSSCNLIENIKDILSGKISVTVESSSGDDDEEEEEKEPPPESECLDEYDGDFEETCCRLPESGELIPDCLEYVSAYNGGIDIEKGQEYWKNKYPGGVVFQPLMPEQGFCGEKTLLFSVADCDNCDGVTDLVWDADNPELVAPGGSVIIEVTDGKLPINWSLEGGTGYSFSGGGGTIENGRAVEIFASMDVCGPTTVKADDNCSDASGQLSYTGGIEWLSTNPTTKFPGGGFIRLLLESGTGLPPYTYSVTGTGWSFAGGVTEFITTSAYIDVYLAADSCEDGSVNVEDACSSATWNITNSGQDVEWLPTNPTTRFPDGGSTALFLQLNPGTGQPPYTYSVTGEGWTLDPSWPSTEFVTEIITSSRYICVNLAADSCVDGSVNVEDACSSATWNMTNSGQDVEWAPTNLTTQFPGSRKLPLFLKDGTGQPPYTYRVTGEGWFFDVDGGVTEIITSSAVIYVYLAADSCVDGSVDVEDACSSATWNITNSGQDIEWSPTNVSELCNGASWVFVLKNKTGQPPYTYSVTGDLVIISDSGPTDTPSVQIVNNGSGGTVTVEDSCSEADWSITEIPESECG